MKLDTSLDDLICFVSYARSCLQWRLEPSSIWYESLGFVPLLKAGVSMAAVRQRLLGSLARYRSCALESVGARCLLSLAGISCPVAQPTSLMKHQPYSTGSSYPGPQNIRDFAIIGEHGSPRCCTHAADAC